MGLILGNLNGMMPAEDVTTCTRMSKPLPGAILLCRPQYDAWCSVVPKPMTRSFDQCCANPATLVCLVHYNVVDESCCLS